MLFAVADTSAQTYYYTQNKVLSGKDNDGLFGLFGTSYKYQCIIELDHRTKLYNITNKYTNAEQTFKDGSPLTESFLMGYEKLIEIKNWTKRHYSIVITFFLLRKNKE